MTMNFKMIFLSFAFISIIFTSFSPGTSEAIPASSMAQNSHIKKGLQVAYVCSPT